MYKDEKTAKYDEAVSHLCAGLRIKLLQIPDALKKDVQEVRIRAQKPLMLICTGQTLFLTPSGRTTCIYGDGLYSVTKGEVEESFRIICGYSVHAHKDEIINGYITLPGGHRAGLCGTASAENGRIIGVRNVSSINLRIARQIKGIAGDIVDSFSRTGRVDSLLIAGAPSSGKTTVLRDLTLQLSCGGLGRYLKTVIVDERGELAAVYNGAVQNDVGINCDVLDGYPKGRGIMLALRTLSPDVIVCDEIGGEDDIRAIEEGVNTGVSFLATVHAGSETELLQRKQIRLLLETGAFGKVALLKGRQEPGRVREIYEAGDLLGEMYRFGNARACGASGGKVLLCEAGKTGLGAREGAAYAAID